MENKQIVIILLIVIVILAAAIGVMFLTSANAKEPTNIKITSSNEQNEGGNLSVAPISAILIGADDSTSFAATRASKVSNRTCEMEVMFAMSSRNFFNKSSKKEGTVSCFWIASV